MTGPDDTCRVTNDWLPLTPAALAALGWHEGDTIKLDVIDGVLVAERTEVAPENSRKLTGVAPRSRK